MTEDITVCLTSCNRYDLLERTLVSFFTWNTHQIKSFIVREDGVISDVIVRLLMDCVKLSKVEVEDVSIIGGARVGLINSADGLMEKVNTEWVFWMEDDWEFYRPGFIEESLRIMDGKPNILQVWLRERNDTNGHPLSGDFLSTSYKWRGFSFNPGLRRLSDWKRLGSYRQAVGLKEGAGAEQRIGLRYYQMGYKAAISQQGYVRHIGDGRHVK